MPLGQGALGRIQHMQQARLAQAGTPCGTPRAREGFRVMARAPCSAIFGGQTRSQAGGQAPVAAGGQAPVIAAGGTPEIIVA